MKVGDTVDLTMNSNQSFIRLTKWLTILMILIIPIQVMIFMFVPMPEDALGFITLMHDNPVMGLLHMDLLYILNNTFLIFFYFLLFMTLNPKNKTMLNIALITGIVGAILYYTSNRSVEMLLLSDKYFSTTDPTLRLSYIAIAESYLDIWKGTAFNTYYVLSAISLILFSIEMLKSSFYKRSTGIIGLISGILMVVPSGFGLVGLIMSLLSLIPWIIFSLMVVIRLSHMETVNVK
jgi:hypothetical protein